MFVAKKKGKRIRKLQTTVYPSKSAPIATKLCENAFWTITDILFFDVDFLLVATCWSRHTRFFCVFARFLRSYVNSDVTSRFLAICCFRLTDYEACTTKSHQTYMRFRFRFPICSQTTCSVWVFFSVPLSKKDFPTGNSLFQTTWGRPKKAWLLLLYPSQRK